MSHAVELSAKTEGEHWSEFGFEGVTVDVLRLRAEDQTTANTTTVKYAALELWFQ